MWAAANKIRYEYSSFSFISKTAQHLLAAISAIRCFPGSRRLLPHVKKCQQASLRISLSISHTNEYLKKKVNDILQ